jgi:MFS family permease
VLTAFVGFGVGGNIPIDTTICLEFLPQNRRFLLALLSIFQPLGVVVCAGISYGLIPRYSCDPEVLKPCSQVAAGEACCTKASNMGWRYSLFTIGGITLIVFILRFVVFRFRESPKFLLYKGRDADAIRVLNQVAAFNRTDCLLTLEDLEALSNEDSSMASNDSKTPVLGAGAKQATASFGTKVKLEFARYKILFSSPKVSYVTIMVWLAYVFDYFAFSVAGTYLPRILLDKGAATNVSVSETYRDYIIIYLPGTVGVLLGTCMYAVPLIGRKWGMVVSSALMGVSLFVYSTVNSQAANVGLNVMEYLQVFFFFCSSSDRC